MSFGTMYLHFVFIKDILCGFVQIHVLTLSDIKDKSSLSSRVFKNYTQFQNCSANLNVLNKI